VHGLYRLRNTGMKKRIVASLAGLLLLSACSASSLPNPMRNLGQGNAGPVNTEMEPTRTPAPPRTPMPSAATAAPAQTPSAQNSTQAGARATQYDLCSVVKPDIAAVKPALPDSSGQIVFVTTDGNIALTDVTGRSRIDITSDAYISEDRQAGLLYQFPTFSSDGKTIAFVGLSTVAEFDGVTQTVHIAPAVNGSTVTSLFATSEFGIPYLDFSPDGQQVAFLTINPRGAAVRVVSSAGGDATVFESGNPMYWHWRRDSSALLTHFNGRAEQSGDASMTVVDVKGANEISRQQIDALPGAFQAPHYAPDGRHMLYVANAGGQDELVLADAAGKPLCAVMPIDNNAYFAWSPDGGRVAVMDTERPVELPAPVIVHDFGTGSGRMVQESASAFFWSPDGSRLATYRLVSDAPQRANSEDRSNNVRINAPAQQNERIALRIEVIDIATGQVTRVADVLPPQQFAQYLQFFDQYSRAVSPWSADGRHMVFTSVVPDNATADIAVATFNPAQTAPDVKRIAAGVVAFWSPR
jgi:Tol biopolymer transport system component